VTDRTPEHHEHDPNDNPNLDPNPDEDPDLEAGGGVKPGHTPSARPPRSKMTLVLIGVIVALLVFFFIAYGIGLWD